MCWVHPRRVRSLLGWVTRRIAPSTLALLAVGALIVAASAASALAERNPMASPSPSARVIALPSESAQVVFPRPTTTPAPTLTADADPVALGASAAAGGVIFQANGAIWRYDGAHGTVTKVGRYGRPTADGTHFIVWVDTGDGEVPTLVDARTGKTTALGPPFARDVDWRGPDLPIGIVIGDTVTLGSRGPFSVTGAAWIRVSPDGARAIVGASGAEPFMVDMRGGARRSFDVGVGANPIAWSPDGRFFAYTTLLPANAVPRDGARLRVFDSETEYDLDVGVTLPGAWRVVWCAPHTLAFSDGAGRETWTNKIARIWSPETGLNAVSDDSHVALSPSCSRDGKTLSFVTAPQIAYEPLEFFAGGGAGRRSGVTVDLASRTYRFVEPRPGYALEGVRASNEHPLMLTVQRHTTIETSLNDVHVSLELILTNLDGSVSERLVRLASDVGFGYYGSYMGPEAMAWSR